MSEISDNVADHPIEETIDEPVSPTPVPVIEPEQDELPSDATINPVDEESQFIYQEETQSLFCIGSNFDEIPQSIIDAYASKTKILDLSKNRFRSLVSIGHFTELEELIVDGNDLDDTHVNFPKLAQLQTLMINKNRLQDIYKLVDQLRQSFPALSHLSLLGNEACPYRIIPTGPVSSSNGEMSSFAQNRSDEEYQRYRHLLIFRIPTLRFLDAREISMDERRIATQLGDILYSIAEAKEELPGGGGGKKNERNENYTPLPADLGATKHRVSVGKVRHVYHGEGSQGNKFVQDGDL